MTDLKQIKELRELTGAGMMDCQKALEESSDNMEKAVEILRKKGEKIATKKSDRDAKEGVIAFSSSDNKIAIVALNCETDFVARNEDFIKSTEQFAKYLLENGKDNFENFANDKIQNELIVKIGENLKLGFFDLIEANVLGFYLHSNKKIASVVSLSSGSEELARDIAMHVAAMNPEYLNPEDIPSETIEKEKEIYVEQLKAEGKPENIIENILKGKIEKFYKDNCLIKQAFIKDDKVSIENLLKNAGENIIIEKYKRYSL